MSAPLGPLTVGSGVRCQVRAPMRRALTEIQPIEALYFFEIDEIIPVPPCLALASRAYSQLLTPIVP